MMYRIALLLACFASLYGDSGYFFCIDGGGSKTILQVVNEEGRVLPLLKDGVESDKIITSGSNINVVGAEGVRHVLSALLDGVSLRDGRGAVGLRKLLPDSRVVAGMAGAGLPQNRQALVCLIQESGVDSERILVMSDAELALQLVHDDGIVLIAGTGSICFGKKGGALFRAGGLGRVLGDEGSGYQIGLQAFKAALAEEYGWGPSTSLTPALKKLFQTSELKSLIPKINLGEMSPSKIASGAPLVFDRAWAGDAVAQEIIDRAAHDLGELLAAVIDRASLFDCEVHLWGGVFKNEHSEEFVQKISASLPAACRPLKMINNSLDNPAVLLAIQRSRGKS